MTWLYIPSSFVPASECSGKGSAPHSSISESSTEPFVTWSAKLVPLGSLLRLWKRERLMKRLSGLTYSRSTAQRGADAWIASLRASRAKTCLSLDGAPASTGSGPDCSSASSTSQTIAVRGSSFWRTSQASLLPPPPLWTKPETSSKSARRPASWENWPTEAGMRNGRIFERPTLEQAINANGGSASRGAWATPDCNSSSYSNGAFGPNIREQALNWPTPAAQDDNKTPDAYKRMRMEKLGRTGAAAETISSLQVRVQAWATPRATDGAKGGPNQRGSAGDQMLPSMAAQWATPTARDHKDGSTSLDNVPVNGLLGRQNLATEQTIASSSHRVLSTVDGRELSPTARTLRPRLNPAFACWLMGWPIWWTNPGITNCVRSEMALFRSKLQQHLSYFFGAPAFACVGMGDE